MIIGPVFMLDGFSKLDNTLNAFSIISFEVMGFPDWLTGLLSFLEFAFGAAVLFNLFTFYFSTALCLIMGLVLAIMHTKGVGKIHEVNYFESIGHAITNQKLPEHPQVIPLLLLIGLILLMLLSQADAKTQIQKTKEHRRRKREERAASKGSPS